MRHKLAIALITLLGALTLQAQTVVYLKSNSSMYLNAMPDESLTLSGSAVFAQLLVRPDGILVSSLGKTLTSTAPNVYRNVPLNPLQAEFFLTVQGALVDGGKVTIRVDTAGSLLAVSREGGLTSVAAGSPEPSAQWTVSAASPAKDFVMTPRVAIPLGEALYLQAYDGNFLSEGDPGKPLSLDGYLRFFALEQPGHSGLATFGSRYVFRTNYLAGANRVVTFGSLGPVTAPWDPTPRWILTEVGASKDTTGTRLYYGAKVTIKDSTTGKMISAVENGSMKLVMSYAPSPMAWWVIKKR